MSLTSPFVTAKIVKQESPTGLNQKKVLLIGESLVAGSVKKVTKNVQLSQLDSLFGDKSQIKFAVKKFKEANDKTEIDVLGLAPASSGTKASCTITVDGTASESKNVKFSVLDDFWTGTATIAKNDSKTDVATKLKDAINGLSGNWTATVSSAVVTVTYDSYGDYVNGTEVKILDSALGLTFTTTQMSSGAGSVSVAGLDDNLDVYHSVIFDKMIPPTTVQTWLEKRFNIENDIQAGVGFTLINDTLANINTAVQSIDSKVFSIFANPNESKVQALPLLCISEFVAKRELRLLEGTDISSISIDAAETTGGIEISSLPYHNVPMSYTIQENSLTLSQLQSLTKAGSSSFVNASGSLVCGDLVTAYKTDEAGNKDNTWKYLNAVDTALSVREYFFRNCKKVFAQTRATAGDIQTTRSMQNVDTIKSYILSLYEDCVDFLLLDGGESSKAFFEKNLSVLFEASTGTFKNRWKV